MSKAVLMLEDGTRWDGEAVGAPGVTIGELRPFTGMADYMALLTDPASAGRILLMTYPSIGNYGVNTEDCEKGKVFARGLIARDVCLTPSNWRSVETLDFFLKRNLTPSISGLDTRQLLRHLRRSGPQNAAICTTPGFEGWDALLTQVKAFSVPADYPAAVNEAQTLTLSEPPVARVAVCDFGSSRMISRVLAGLGVEITLLPPASVLETVVEGHFDGLLLPNGPGLPAEGVFTEKLRAVMDSGLPVLGLGLGFMYLTLAQGMRNTKMQLGHWGANQPVRHESAGHTAITRQTHDHVVCEEDIDTNVCEIILRNGNDNTIEGLAWKKTPVFGSYHTPVALGPVTGGDIVSAFFQRVLAGKKGE